MQASCFSPDGSVLAVAAGASATLWDPASNRLVAALQPPSAAGGGVLTSLHFITGSPHLVGLLQGQPGSTLLVVWNLLSTAVAWSLHLPVVSLTADPLHPLFAAALQLPSSAVAEDGSQQQEQQQGVHSHVLVFDTAAGAPKFSCPVPNAAVSSLQFVNPGSRIYSAGASGSNAVSALLMTTSDRQYALLQVPGSTVMQEEVVPLHQQQNEQQHVSAFEAAFGIVGADSASAAIDKSAAVQQQVVLHLFDAPSHVLPPPTQLCSAFLQLLIAGSKQS
jgi:NET1-associated nuclear protein 1 (U3 small nucleolar RNA-associated protein 17)